MGHALTEGNVWAGSHEIATCTHCVEGLEGPDAVVACTDWCWSANNGAGTIGSVGSLSLTVSGTIGSVGSLSLTVRCKGIPWGCPTPTPPHPTPSPHPHHCDYCCHQFILITPPPASTEACEPQSPVTVSTEYPA